MAACEVVTNDGPWSIDGEDAINGPWRIKFSGNHHKLFKHDIFRFSSNELKMILNYVNETRKHTPDEVRA
jgi:hypothetical protein